jgi:hypothetical protein
MGLYCPKLQITFQEKNIQGGKSVKKSEISPKHKILLQKLIKLPIVSKKKQ